MDARIEKLSRQLTEYACSLQAGEKVLIEYEGKETLPLVQQVIRDAYRLGAVPFVEEKAGRVLREILLGAKEEQLALQCEVELARMKEMDAYISIRGGDNIAELSDVPTEQLQLYDKMLQPVLDQRVNETKWVILRYPTPSMAQLAGKSLTAFEDFYFQVCNMDYWRMSLAMDALVELMNRTESVRMIGPGTDLSFSIAGIPAVKCDGKMNIPDGEVYTAPVRETVNGVITYNAASEMQGFVYENVRFEIEKGRIVHATANDTARINALLDADEGARYFGEFAIGVNPFVLEPMKDILFDEKICGSIHLTPGMAYEDADNGNRSAVHWDLVLIQRPEYGGGEIWFDDRLIRKDGLFVVEELLPLNPDRLMKEEGVIGIERALAGSKQKGSE
ncbi:aminopeptidase [Ihubacter sp. rT4E-8]|uniref:aminopeptidase n=1 Tax=Ihubacter sp. rT4E-8 TaxID=3242369 RepID=UPI003CEC7323